MESEDITIPDLHNATGIPERSLHNYIAAKQSPGIGQLYKIRINYDIDLNYLVVGDAAYQSSNIKKLRKFMASLFIRTAMFIAPCPNEDNHAK